MRMLLYLFQVSSTTFPVDQYAYVQQTGSNAVPLSLGESAMGQIPHVTAHAAIVAAVFAAI